MGLIDAGNYLGGRLALQPNLAVTALRASLADRFDWSPEEASAIVYELVVTNMANAIREVSISKGYDPRDFLFLAYGGTLPLFAWAIASTVGITEVVIPDGSSVFCARGLLAADSVVRVDQSVNWSLSDETQVARVNAAGDKLARQAMATMRADGFTDADVTVTRRGDFQFPGQVFQLSMRLPDTLGSEEVGTLSRQFFALYERTYGAGTAWEETPPVMINYTVEARASRHNRFEAKPRSLTATASPTPSKAVRRVYLPAEREHVEVPVYAETALNPGAHVAGPCIIDATDTTILVPSGVAATRDALSNYRLQPSEV